MTWHEKHPAGSEHGLWPQFNSNKTRGDGVWGKACKPSHILWCFPITPPNSHSWCTRDVQGDVSAYFLKNLSMELFPMNLTDLFWTCCHWLLQLPHMAANSPKLSLMPAVQRNVLPLLNPVLVILISINFLSFCYCRTGGWPFQLCHMHLIHCLCDNLWPHSPQPFPLQPDEKIFFFCLSL